MKPDFVQGIPWEAWPKIVHRQPAQLKAKFTSAACPAKQNWPRRAVMVAACTNLFASDCIYQLQLPLAMELNRYPGKHVDFAIWVSA